MWITLVVLLIAEAILATAIPDRCIYLATIKNGGLTYTDPSILNKVGGRVKFFCNDGFELVGHENSECQSDGIWSNLTPKCVDRRCPPIAGIQDGTMSDYCNNPGCKPKFQCDPAWKLTGPAEIKCENGQWSDGVPTCEVNYCSPITTFMSGDILGYKNPPTAGTKLEVKCDDGFNLEGNGEATCLPNLDWSAELGSCVCGDKTSCRKAKFSCPRIISTPFGTHTSDGTKLGSWVKLTGCQNGFGMPLGGGRNSKCGKDRVYSFIPQCTYNRCPHIEAIEGGVVTNTIKYGLNDRVQFKCNEGYKLKGLNDMQCKGTKQWGPGSGIVTCEKRTCPDILTFENGIIKDYDNVVNHMITFECNPGYTLKGWKGIRCICKPGEEPKWQTDPPKCVPPNYVATRRTTLRPSTTTTTEQGLEERRAATSAQIVFGTRDSSSTHKTPTTSPRADVTTHDTWRANPSVTENSPHTTPDVTEAKATLPTDSEDWAETTGEDTVTRDTTASY